MVMSVWPRFLAHPVYSFNQVLIFSSHNNIFRFAQSSKEILLLYTVHFNSSFVKNGSNWVVVHIIRKSYIRIVWYHCVAVFELRWSQQHGIYWLQLKQANTSEPRHFKQPTDSLSLTTAGRFWRTRTYVTCFRAFDILICIYSELIKRSCIPSNISMVYCQFWPILVSLNLWFHSHYSFV